MSSGHASDKVLARRLVSGAGFSVIRLALVAIAGVLGTVVLARAFGPEVWGTYSAVWSTSLLASAVLVHGVRDRLAAAGTPPLDGHPDTATAVDDDWNVAFTLQIPIIIVLALVLYFPVQPASSDGLNPIVAPGTFLLAASGLTWLCLYPLRLPAMVRSLRAVRPMRVMVLESIEAVIVPIVAVAILFVVPDVRGEIATSYGILSAAIVGFALAMLWGRPLQPSTFRQRVLRGRRQVVAAIPLSGYQLGAAGRELAVPMVLLLTGGATVAGAYGLALPLGAMVTLALAAAAQPAYAMLTALQNDPEKVGEFTNIVRRLLASIVATALPVIWLVVPNLVEPLFGSQWNFAATTIALVMSAFAVNAAMGPWVNILIPKHHLNSRLLVVQALTTLAVVGAAAASDTLGAAGVASVFLGMQLLFAIWAGWMAQREVPRVRLADQSIYLVAAVAGVGVVHLVPSPWSLAGVLVPSVIILVSPARSSALAAWRSVARMIR